MSHLVYEFGALNKAVNLTCLRVALARKLQRRYGFNMRNLSILLLLAITSSVSAGELILGDFNVSMSKDQILSRKGKPLERIEQADFITDIFKYSDLTFYFTDENLIGAYSETRGVCASNSICIGSKVSDAIKAWGEPHPKTDQGKEYLEFYNPGEFSCWYRINGSENIQSIEIACQP